MPLRVKKKQRAPGFWRGPAICSNLEWADAGFPPLQAPPQLRIARNYLRELGAVGQMMLQAPRDHGARAKNDAQAIWTAAGQRGLRSESLLDTVTKRFRKWGLPEMPHLVVRAKHRVCMLAPSWANQVMRTWTNGWLTSARMPGDTQPCRYGCVGQKDDLQHYIGCPGLRYNQWALAPRTLQGRQHGPWPMIPITKFFGLQPPRSDATVEDCFRCTVSYRCCTTDRGWNRWLAPSLSLL